MPYLVLSLNTNNKLYANTFISKITVANTNHEKIISVTTSKLGNGKQGG